MSVKLLILDDEKDFVESLAERLSLRDFKVKTAFNGEDALKIMEENEFDVIILDVQMPGMDGIEALKRIKETNQLAHVLMLTGHATVQTAIDGMKQGAYDYLMKPIETKELINKLMEAYSLVEEQKERIRKAEIDNIMKNKGW